MWASISKLHPQFTAWLFIRAVIGDVISLLYTFYLLLLRCYRRFRGVAPEQHEAAEVDAAGEAVAALAGQAEAAPPGGWEHVPLVPMGEQVTILLLSPDCYPVYVDTCYISVIIFLDPLNLCNEFLNPLISSTSF